MMTSLETSAKTILTKKFQFTTFLTDSYYASAAHKARTSSLAKPSQQTSSEK